MRRQIFIYIYGENIKAEDDSVPVCWTVREGNQMPGPVYYGDLKTAANHATGCRVVVFVSGTNILLTHAALPTMNKQRLARAIPFALEEHVASDVEQMHFALGNRFGDKIACAAVERQDIDNWLQLLKNANIQADVLISECFGVHVEEGAWSILINRASGMARKALWRGEEGSGAALDLPNLPFILRNVLDNSENQKPEQVSITVCNDNLRRQTLISAQNDELPTVDEQAELESPSTPEELNDETMDSGGDANAQTQIQTQTQTQSQLQTEGDIKHIIEQVQKLCDEREIGCSYKESEQSYLGLLCQGFNEADSINLLQGEYSRREQLEKLIRPWRTAIGLAAAWLLIQGGLLVTEYYQLVNQDRELRNQITAVYQQALPSSKNVPNRTEMERALEKLRHGGDSKRNWFELLSRAGEVISDTNTVTLRSIRYKDDKMDLDLDISDLASLDELKTKLTKQAELNVEIVSASARGGKVESRLQVQLGEPG